MTSTQPSKARRAPTQVWIVIERDGVGWHAYAPAVPGCRAAGSSIADARRNLRRQVARRLQANDSSPLEILTDVRLLAPAPKRAVSRAHTARAAARRAEFEAARREGEAARFLRSAGMIPADIAEVLRLPLQRVRDLLG